MSARSKFDIPMEEFQIPRREIKAPIITESPVTSTEETHEEQKRQSVQVKKVVRSTRQGGSLIDELQQEVKRPSVYKTYYMDRDAAEKLQAVSKETGLSASKLLGALIQKYL